MIYKTILFLITLKFFALKKFFFAKKLLNRLKKSNNESSARFLAASLFKPSEGFYPCRQTSIYYLANYENGGGGGGKGGSSSSGSLLEEHLSERPCQQSAAHCAVKLFASWVRGTNLLLVVVRQACDFLFTHISKNINLYFLSKKYIFKIL
jgi:hypothetical protein